MVESSGAAILDKAVMQAVRPWRFVPAHRNGEAIAAWVQVGAGTGQFRLTAR